MRSLAIYALAAAVIALAVCTINRTLSATFFVLETATAGHFQPLNWVTFPPQHEKQVITVNGNMVDIPLWLSQNTTPRAAIILYSPLAARAAPLDTQDRIAESFAKLGYAVIRVSTQQKVITIDDYADVEAAVDALVTRFPSIKHIGIMAFCAGTGPALRVMAEWKYPEIEPFAILYAPYYRLTDHMAWSLTGVIHFSGRIFGIHPSEENRVLFDTFVQTYGIDTDDLEEDPTLRQFDLASSPMMWADKISDKDIYIIHARNDGMVAFTDSLKLRDHLSPNNNVHMLITDILTHDGFAPFTLETFFATYLPAFNRLQDMTESILIQHSPL